MQTIINPPWKDDLWYAKQWLAYYRQRTQFIQSVASVLAAILAMAIVATLASHLVLAVNPLITNAVAVAVLLACSVLVFRFWRQQWKMRTW